MLVPRAWRKFQIFLIFDNLLYGKSPLSSESKNYLNIPCNYTMGRKKEHAALSSKIVDGKYFLKGHLNYA